MAASVRSRGLFWRLFGAGALIALVATAAATFATVRSTTVGVQQAQQQSLHDDARAYDALIAYAATHRSWAGADKVVARLAAASKERVVVADTEGRALVDSAGGHRVERPERARATIDPLNVDTTLLPDAQVPVDTIADTAIPCAEGDGRCRLYPVAASSIDARVVGPFRGASERGALQQLTRRIDRCLARADLAPITAVRADLSVTVSYPERHTVVARCIDDGRRAILGPFVAPRALLFVGDGRARADVLWDLSTRTWVRIALLGVAVLGLTLLLGALLARRVVRPLRAMAATALRASEGDLSARVVHRRHDEVGELADAFNAMADRREQLETARRRMISDVSHELRTPVTNARAWLEGAQDGLVEPDAALLDSLHEEMLHLQTLIEDLHQLSMGDAGEMRLDRERIDVAALLDQVTASFRGAAEAAGVALTAGAAPGSALDADPVRIRQALGNLVANALRHTPPGGRVELRGEPGLLSVSDTGEGIPAEDLPHVFDRFHRVDASRSRASGGSGLGLAIVKQIVEAHSGTVGIESAPGTGTTVRISIPGQR